MVSKKYIKEGEYITESVHTDNQTAEIKGHLPYRKLKVETEDSEIIPNNKDVETITISTVDNLDIVRGQNVESASVVNNNSQVNVLIDSVEVIKNLTDGSVSFNLTTQKSAGNTIKIVAESLANHPAESDSAIIEVVSE